jgi:DNA gyrase subunit A
MDSDQILFFSDRGRLHKISAKMIPEAELNTIGQPVTQLLTQLAKQNEKVSAILSTSMTLDTAPDDKVIVMLTNQGKVLVTSARAVLGQRSKSVIKLDKGDRLKQVMFARTSDHLYIVGAGAGQEEGRVLRCKVSDFRVVKSACAPLRGLTFMEDRKKVKAQATESDDDDKENDDDDDDEDVDDKFIADDKALPTRTVGMVIVPDERMQNATEEDGPFILYATKRGKGKLVAVNSYRSKRRGGSGVVCVKFKEDNPDRLATVTYVDRIAPDVTDEILLSTTGGISNRLSVKNIPSRTASSRTVGVPIIKLTGNDTLKSVNLLPGAVAQELD